MAETKKNKDSKLVVSKKRYYIPELGKMVEAESLTAAIEKIKIKKDK